MRIAGLVVALGFILCGCAQTYRAEVYPIAPSLITSQFSGSGPVLIKNEATEGRIQLGANNAGYTFWGDLRQITDTAISLLSGELSNRGFFVEKEASKVLKVKVIETRISQDMGTRCSMQFYVETADGYKRVYSAYNSGFTHTRTCDGAITKAVADVLNDSKIIEYMK